VLKEGGGNMAFDDEVNEILDEEIRKRIRTLIKIAHAKNIPLVVSLEQGRSINTLGWVDPESLAFFHAAWKRDRAFALFRRST